MKNYRVAVRISSTGAFVYALGNGLPLKKAQALADQMDQYHARLGQLQLSVNVEEMNEGMMTESKALQFEVDWQKDHPTTETTKDIDERLPFRYKLFIDEILKGRKDD